MHDRTILRTTAVVSALLVTVAISASVSAGSSSASDEGIPRPPAELPARLGPATLDPLVQRRLALEGSVDVLVTLDGGAALASARARGIGDSRALLRATIPAYRALKAALRDVLPHLTVLRDYRTLPILFVRIRSEAQLDRLRAAPSVVAVGADRRDRATLGQSLPLIGQPAAAGDGHTGTGVAVAVLDTGIDYLRPAFGDCSGGPGSAGCRVVYAQDFATDDGQRDANGHGSNVGGIVAGVAPGAGLLALDVFEGDSAFTSDQVEALNFAIANQATYNVRAINMSLGNSTRNTSPCSDPSDARVAAFANARAAGILPVVSSGNARYSGGSPQVGISRPACIPGALPAGAVYDANVGSQTYSSAGCSDATTQVDQITCFSQVWTGAMMLAPGARITAAGTTYSGTSMAAPHVAGAVAVLHDAAGVASDERSAAPTPSQVESALLGSGPSIVDALVGQSFRRLDLPAAIAALGGSPPPTTSTTTTATTSTTSTTPPGTTTTPTTTVTTPTTTSTTGVPTTTITGTTGTATTTPPTSTATPPPPACTIAGTRGSDVLGGTAGDDVICGRGGTDVLIPGGGNDVLLGGAGFDWVSFEGADGAVTVDLAAGEASAPNGQVALDGIEGAIGTPFGDTLVGDGGGNDFVALGGDDVIDGKGGFDYVRFDHVIRRIRANLSNGIARGEGRDTLASIEGVTGGSKGDLLVGSARSNRIEGLQGEDRVVGSGSGDTLLGGRGADDLLGGPGEDACEGGPGRDVLVSCEGVARG